MAPRRKEEKEAEVCRAITTLRDTANSQVTLIKERWRQNYDMFTYGSQNSEKEEWQTKFSVNKLQTSIRTAAGRLVEILVNNPDWFELEPASPFNSEAAFLAPAFQKIINYYIEAAKFKRHCGSFFLSSLISAGSMYIGWKKRFVQNPDYVIKKTEEARRKEAARIAKNVANPSVATEMELDGANFEAELSDEIDAFTAEAQGLEIDQERIAPRIQIGCLDLKDLNHEKIYWDPNVTYLEDSMWRAFEIEVNKFELNFAAKMGVYSKAAVDRIGSKSDFFTRNAIDRLRYKNLTHSTSDRSDLVKLLFYFGPLIVDNEIKKENYFAIIANDTIILRDGEYPFWEPPGHHTPVITAAVRKIPHRATGAGISDSAVDLQRLYDSNWQLICDSFRYNISGINVVNHAALVDKSQLNEGVYPGMTLHVRTKPEEAFSRINLTSNIENQHSPVQAMLEQAIDSLTGVNELMVGGGNQYSRTPAAETTARLEAGQDNINTVALDLEEEFLVPALQKIFARVLQFGVPEIASNPELSLLLREDELRAISQLNSGGRMQILNQWYKFKINGFSKSRDKNAEAQRDNELMSIVNSGGPLASLINLPEFIKRYFKNRGIKDAESLLVVTNSPIEIVTSENKVLMAGNYIAPNPSEDLEFHLQMHAPLAQSPQATPAMVQHFQETQQLLQEMSAQGAPETGGGETIQ